MSGIVVKILGDVALTKNSEGERPILKIVVGVAIAVVILLVGVIAAPFVAIGSIINPDTGAEGSLYSEMQDIMQEIQSEWDSNYPGTNTYPDVALIFAYFCVEEGTFDLSNINIDKEYIEELFISFTMIENNVVCKDVLTIAMELYPENEKKQNEFLSAYNYWSNVLASIDEIIKRPVNQEEITLSDVSVIVYDTGLKIPHYLQYDEKWGSIAYGDNTIKYSACGPTCASMLVSYFTNTYVTPDMAAAYSVQNGYRVPEGTAWGFFAAYMSEYGITCNDLGLNIESVINELSVGHPVIASMAPGTFTDYGHFIVLRGIDASGNIYVNDPNDNNYSKMFYSKTFSPSLIYSEAKNFWSFHK